LSLQVACTFKIPNMAMLEFIVLFPFFASYKKTAQFHCGR